MIKMEITVNILGKDLNNISKIKSEKYYVVFTLNRLTLPFNLYRIVLEFFDIRKGIMYFL